MSIRKIKDARDLSTNELIYFKGHAKATYMSDGKTVEDAINSIGTGGGGAEEVYIGEEEPTNPSIELWVDESIETDDDGNVLDSEMSDSSENAVQNKVIKVYVDTIVGNIGAILDNINGEEA